MEILSLKVLSMKELEEAIKELSEKLYLFSLELKSERLDDIKQKALKQAKNNLEKSRSVITAILARK